MGYIPGIYLCTQRQPQVQPETQLRDLQQLYLRGRKGVRKYGFGTGDFTSFWTIFKHITIGHRNSGFSH